MAALRENLGLAGQPACNRKRPGLRKRREAASVWVLRDFARLVLFNPVLDLEFTQRFSDRRLTTWLGSWALRWRYGEQQLRAGSPIHRVRSELSNLAPSLVCFSFNPPGQLSQPTLILHGTADHLVPIEEVENFQRGQLGVSSRVGWQDWRQMSLVRMETTGSDCKLVTFPGEGHFFFNWRAAWLQPHGVGFWVDCL